MIWTSTVTMTLIDVAHVAGVLSLVWLFRRRRTLLAGLGALPAMRLVLAGLAVIAAFYTLDLAIMHLLPPLVGADRALSLMRDLHLEWAWVSTALSVGLMGAGIVHLMRVLLPKAGASIDALERIAAERGAALEQANARLEREHAELGALSKRYALAAEGSEAGIWEIERPSESGGRFSWRSDRYGELLGLTSGHSAPVAWIDRIHADDEDRIRRAFERHLVDRTPFDVECRLRFGNDRYRWYHLCGRAAWDEDGTPTRMAGSIRDVSDQRRAVERIRELDLAIENAMTGVSRLDTEGRFTEVRPAYASMLGYDDPCELIGQSWAVTVAGDDCDSARRGYEEMLATGRAQTRVRARRKDGSEFVKELLLVKIANELGEHEGHFCFMRDVTPEHRLNEQLSYQASHDALTGLINRAELESRLESALASARGGEREHALLYMDLDQFKVINDTCGHFAGDELLRQLAQVLEHQVRARDTVARLGGDEFGILLEDCSEAQALRIADGLRSAVREFVFAWEGRTFGIGASIGLVAISSRSGTLSDVLKDVDSACYAAKEDGRDRIHLHRPDDARVTELHGEMQWVGKISAALAENRLVLYRQPLVGVNEAREGGSRFEVLVRLRDEAGRLVSPGAFLPAAERFGLMPRIDRWVIFATLDWLRLHAEHDGVELCHVNVSGASLADEGFLDEVLTQLERTSVRPELLCFEITETAAISNLSFARRFVDALRERGCSFALDDFGSGLSSFGYLKNLPIDFVKIDGIFVRDMLNDPIDLATVKAIHEVTKVLGKSSIAEFVETQESLAMVREIGIDFAQGYWLGPPEPLDVDADAGMRAAR